MSTNIDTAVKEYAVVCGYGTLADLVLACAESERITDGQALRFMERLHEANKTAETPADRIWDQMIGPMLDRLADEIKADVA